jgi:light-regulated signal transduction histidine kinase (bacteriophytochrome)
LERSNDELQAFGHIVSHDLQTPLMTIKGYLQLLEETRRGHLDEEAMDFIGRAIAAADSMSSLIADLLAYARAGIVVGPLQFTDSAHALQRALGNLRVEIEDAGAQVTHGALPVVAADPDQLARLFQNLVGNALKYRSPGKPLEVHVEAARAAGGWEFCVRDTGIGISDDTADGLFTMFSRGPGVTGFPGSGIGLAICKKIVEAHGGRIWATPLPHGGTAFRFTMPAAGRAAVDATA